MQRVRKAARLKRVRKAVRLKRARKAARLKRALDKLPGRSTDAWA